MGSSRLTFALSEISLVADRGVGYEVCVFVEAGVVIGG